jgi:2'-5' RNA ligase
MTADTPPGASLRLFYALWPDDGVRGQLSALLSGLSGRLVPAANLHITLAFLGQQPAARVPELLHIAEQAALPPMPLVLDRWGMFRRHGVVWVGMSNVPPALLAGRQRLVELLTENAVSFDAGGSFKPHVTLARDAPAIGPADFTPITWNISGKLELVSSSVIERRVRYRLL